MRDFLKMTLRDFMIIAAGILINAAIFCTIFYPDYIFDIRFLWQIITMAALTSLLHIVFYSKKELTKRQMLVRQIIHACLLLTLLLVLVYTWRWLEPGDVVQVIVFIALAACVYVSVCVLSLHYDKKVAKELNARLKQYKKKETE
jgi:MFS superfamily sulfate permease-like transporter